MTDLKTAPIGTPHEKATCCWCGTKLVVGKVAELRCWLCPVDWQRQVSLALTIQPKKGEQVVLNVPLPSQAAFEECASRNILWGGQAGPGKSHGVRWWLYKRSLVIPNHKAVLLRENSKQLETTHLFDMRRELPLFGARLVDDVARFPNGSEIHCGHMAEADAVFRYTGTEYGAIVADEAALYPVYAQGTTTLAELRTRARKDYVDVQGQAVDPRFVCVTNPGGPSASWLCDMFVDHSPDYERFPKLKGKYDPNEWAYIPARVDDNPYMREDYKDTALAGLSKVRYQQLAEGDWHVFAGQFFSSWSDAEHTRTLAIAPTTDWFGSMDWGYNAPGCVIWWACLPDGHYHIAKAWKFSGMSAEEVGREIKTLTKALGIKRLRYLVADPAMWQKTGAGRGQSIAETLTRAGIPMRAGDNDRFNGWTRCQSLLRQDAAGVPWLTVDPIEAKYLARTIPAAVSAKNDADDVDTTIDDHGLDAWRYGAMSRPMPTLLAQRKRPKGSAGQLLQEHLTELAVA